MAKEAASKFVQAILNDEELRQRTEKMKPEDAVPLGKEMGYDFTLEEFTDVMNEDRELDIQELAKIAGGCTTQLLDGHKNAVEHGIDIKHSAFKVLQKWKDTHCTDGGPHQFVDTIEDNEVFGLWSTTFLVSRCSICKYSRSRHIKFGEGGEIIFDD